MGQKFKLAFIHAAAALIVLAPPAANLALAVGAANQSQTVSVATYVAPTSAVFSYYARFIFVARVKRLFLTDPARQARQSAGIVNSLFTRSATALARGDAGAAKPLLADMLAERSRLTLELAAAGGTSPAGVEPLLADEAVRLSYLPTDAQIAAPEITVFIHRLQAESLRSIDKELNRDGLTSGQKTIKLDRLVEEYAKRTIKTDENLAQKLTLVGQLKIASADADLDLIEKNEDTLIARTTKLPADQVVRLAQIMKAQGELEPTLGVLQKLIDTAPSLKAEIEAAMEPLLTEEAKRLDTNPNQIVGLLRAVSAINARDGVVKKIEARIETKDGQTKLRLKIETIERDEKIEVETRAKKQAETDREDKDKTDREKQTDRPSEKQIDKATDRPRKSEPSESAIATVRPTATAKITASPTATPTATPEVETESLEIKIKNGAFDKTALTVKKGRRLTVTVRNDDTTARTVTLSNGQSSGKVLAGYSQTLDSFIISDAVTFSAAGVSGSGTITPSG